MIEINFLRENFENISKFNIIKNGIFHYKFTHDNYDFSSLLVKSSVSKLIAININGEKYDSFFTTHNHAHIIIIPSVIDNISIFVRDDEITYNRIQQLIEYFNSESKLSSITDPLSLIAKTFDNNIFTIEQKNSAVTKFVSTLTNEEVLNCNDVLGHLETVDRNIDEIITENNEITTKYQKNTEFKQKIDSLITHINTYCNEKSSPALVKASAPAPTAPAPAPAPIHHTLPLPPIQAPPPPATFENGRAVRVWHKWLVHFHDYPIGGPHTPVSSSGQYIQIPNAARKIYIAHSTLGKLVYGLFHYHQQKKFPAGIMLNLNEIKLAGKHTVSNAIGSITVS